MLGSTVTGCGLIEWGTASRGWPHQRADWRVAKNGNQGPDGACCGWGRHVERFRPCGHRQDESAKAPACRKEYGSSYSHGLCGKADTVRPAGEPVTGRWLLSRRTPARTVANPPAPSGMGPTVQRVAIAGGWVARRRPAQAGNTVRKRRNPDGRSAVHRCRGIGNPGRFMGSTPVPHRTQFDEGSGVPR
jgi:hypothetical protein